MTLLNNVEITSTRFTGGESQVTRQESILNATIAFVSSIIDTQ